MDIFSRASARGSPPQGPTATLQVRSSDAHAAWTIGPVAARRRGAPVPLGRERAQLHQTDWPGLYRGDSPLRHGPSPPVGPHPEAGVPCVHPLAAGFSGASRALAGGSPVLRRRSRRIWPLMATDSAINRVNRLGGWTSTARRQSWCAICAPVHPRNPRNLGSEARIQSGCREAQGRTPSASTILTKARVSETSNRARPPQRRL